MKIKEPNEMAMIHKVRELMAKETRGMSHKKLLEYFKSKAKKIHGLQTIERTSLKKAA